MESNKKPSLKERFKSFKPEYWVIIALEFVIGIIFLIADITFFKDLANNVTFLGEGKKAYEVAVAIVVLLLFIMMIFLVVYDVFFRDYKKEAANVQQKEIYKGKVVVVPPDDDNKEDEKTEVK